MKLTSYVSAGQTLVSNNFIDRYMAGASGEYVKVYLYLLRLQSEPDVSVTLLADRLDLTEKDVMRALRYWETARLISLQKGAQGELSGITLLTEQARGAETAAVPGPAAKAASEEGPGPAGKAAPEESSGQAAQADLPSAVNAAPAAPAASRQPEAEAAALPARKNYDLETIGRLQEQEDFALALIAAEQYLQRTLTRRDTDLFAYLYQELGFSGELLEYLVEYCVNGKSDAVKKPAFLRYIESVALGWHSEGVRTLEQAKAAGRDFTEEGLAVVKAFGIRGRNLTEAERLRIERWHRDLGMSAEMIKEACARTMDSIHEASFPYAEKILTTWAEKKLHTVEAVKSQDSSRKPQAPAAGKNRNDRFAFAYQRQTDYDAILNEETPVC